MTEMTPPALPDRDERSLSHKTRVDLGWEALTEQLAARCHTVRGAALGRALAPLGTIDEARQRQQTVSEARALQDSGEPLSFGGISDIQPSLQRSEKGGVLLPGELVEIASTLHAGRGCGATWRAASGGPPGWPRTPSGSPSCPRSPDRSATRSTSTGRCATAPRRRSAGCASASTSCSAS